MKKSIITYATVLEKVFARFKDKGFIPSEDELNLGGLSLGRLASKIDIQTGKLVKFRLKFENNI